MYKDHGIEPGLFDIWTLLMLWTVSFVEFQEYVSSTHQFIEIEGLDSTDESSDEEEPVAHKKASRVKFSRAPIKVPVY